MRSVKVTLPQEHAEKVREIAFDCGVSGVNISTVNYFSKSGESEKKASVSFEAATPKAKKFIDSILGAEFFDPETCSLTSRERRSIVSSVSLKEITYPWVAPGIDICQELSLFSHVTIAFIGRVFLAASLLSYGLMNQNLLLMIAGMMFLPLLPIMSAIGFSFWIREWAFLSRAVMALVVALALLVLSGIMIGSMTEGPIRFTEFAPMSVSIIISIAVGLASGLGMTDDGGRREMIGLAATAQIAIIPAWLGIAIAQGLPSSATSTDLETRILTLILNILSVVLGSLFIYVATKAVDPSLRKLYRK